MVDYTKPLREYKEVDRTPYYDGFVVKLEGKPLQKRLKTIYRFRAERFHRNGNENAMSGLFLYPADAKKWLDHDIAYGPKAIIDGSVY